MTWRAFSPRKAPITGPPIASATASESSSGRINWLGIQQILHDQLELHRPRCLDEQGVSRSKAVAEGLGSLGSVRTADHSRGGQAGLDGRLGDARGAVAHRHQEVDSGAGCPLTDLT